MHYVLIYMHAHHFKLYKSRLPFISDIHSHEVSVFNTIASVYSAFKGPTLTYSLKLCGRRDAGVVEEDKEDKMYEWNEEVEDIPGRAREGDWKGMIN
jgi:hypothetical protein